MFTALPALAGATILASFVLAPPGALAVSPGALAAPRGPNLVVQDCNSAGEADFNGDGYDDAVVADPAATVEGQEQAGQVHVLYGGPGGVGESANREVLYQGLAGVGDTLESGDFFGDSVLAARVDEDNCADLVVGVPFEDMEAGIVHVIFGSPEGLGHGAAPIVLSQADFGGAAESADHFGWSLAVEAPGGPDATTLAIGAPDEDIGSLTDTGVVDLIWISGNAAFQGIQISQNTAGVPGAAEVNDGFGWSVAVGFVRGLSDFPDLIAGTPFESFGSVDAVGAIIVVDDVEPFKTSFTGQGLSQNSSGVPGVAEGGDLFGFSLAYGQAGTTGRLGVGVPLENIGSIRDAGALQFFSSPGGTSLIPGPGINQNSTGILGGAEADDRFGFVLGVAEPSITGGGVQIIVGNLFEDVGSLVDAGAVQVFPAASPTSDFAYDQNSPGIVGSPAAGDNFGAAVDGAGGTAEGVLLVGVPFDNAYSTGEVHVIPYGGGTPRQWVPGANGIPSTGAAAFGLALSG